MICSSSASRKVGLLHTPSTVSSWDVWGIWQETNSTKEESALKLREKRRGKSSGLTYRATPPPRLPPCRSPRKILQYSKEISASVTSEFSHVSVIQSISLETDFSSNFSSPCFGAREKTLAWRVSSFLEATSLENLIALLEPAIEMIFV